MIKSSLISKFDLELIEAVEEEVVGIETISEMTGMVNKDSIGKKIKAVRIIKTLKDRRKIMRKKRKSKM